MKETLQKRKSIGVCNFRKDVFAAESAGLFCCCGDGPCGLERMETQVTFFSECKRINNKRTDKYYSSLTCGVCAERSRVERYDLGD